MPPQASRTVEPPPDNLWVTPLVCSVFLPGGLWAVGFYRRKVPPAGSVLPLHHAPPLFPNERAGARFFY